VVDDGSNETPGAPPPKTLHGPPSKADTPPGLRAQFGATIQAVKRLVRAHIDLAKTEIGEIVGEVKRMVMLAGVALGAFFLVGILFSVGLFLFLGEWLFGSIGWGVLLGTVFLIDVAVIALLLALDVKGARLTSSLLVALIVGVGVGLLLGLDLTHRGWTALGDSVGAAYSANTRAVLLAAGVSAGTLALLGFAGGIRDGFRHAVLRLFVWGIIGVAIGLFTVLSIPPTVGAAVGVLAGLIAWPLVAGRDLIRTGVDGDAIAKKFTPEQTIELTKETIEWVRARTPLVPKS
jgi:hypothetical protein